MGQGWGWYKIGFGLVSGEKVGMGQAYGWYKVGLKLL